DQCKDRAIAVVLSGTASDGAAGIQEIKAAGGITIAQDPDDSQHDGMPRAAINTGVIDLILPAGRIGAELARLANHPLVRSAPAAPAPPDEPPGTGDDAATDDQPAGVDG